TTASPSRSTTASTRSWDRSKTATRAPSSTKRSTSAKPSPEPPPVTSAASPSSQHSGTVLPDGVVTVPIVRKTDGQHDHSGLGGRIFESRYPAEPKTADARHTSARRSQKRALDAQHAGARQLARARSRIATASGQSGGVPGNAGTFA